MLIHEYIKHILRIILKRKNYDYPFYKMQSRIHPETILNKNAIISWAEQALSDIGKHEDESNYLSSDNPIIKEGYKLKIECCKKYYLKYLKENDIRILIHVPTVNQTIAGHSLFSNLSGSLNYLGVKVKNYYSGEDIIKSLSDFKPSVFITSDNEAYISSIDWNAVKKYSIDNRLKIGITASLEEYGNTPLPARIKRADRLNVCFYYSFRAKENIMASDSYLPFRNTGRELFSIEYGANPLIYYPIPGIDRDINYVFLASSSYMKRERYVQYLDKIFSKYPGFLDGPGWKSLGKFNYNKDRDRYIFSRGKVGLNLHLSNQISTASELNERTYILAMCGIPQIIDNPPLLQRRFGNESMFITESPDEYYEMFKYLLNNPDEGKKRAINAQREVFERHTSFQRADQFINNLKALF